MKLGKLEFVPALDYAELLAEPTARALARHHLDSALVASIDSSLADTTAFCEAYEIGLDISANCIVVEAKRADRTWYAACIILATHKADVNGAIRKHLDARKLSFASMDVATSLTYMEYGGITPIGLPSDWPILIDNNVVSKERVIVGSGVRGSKLLVPTQALVSLPNATLGDFSKP
jgi:prolyl-tRNA editing enzyme YbaK/EbsC (Cys-tRNA(Pro) deacylase)